MMQHLKMEAQKNKESLQLLNKKNNKSSDTIK